MKNRKELECFIDQLQDSAVKDFRQTEQYALLEEKLEHMNRDCDTMFRSDEKDFAQACFSVLGEADAYKETFVYRKGYEDCVSLLKWLGVLA